ncbi:MAG: Fic family protein [bacterium]
MADGFRPPKDKDELEDREVRGFWKAIALSKKIGESRERITLDTILRIHRTMFESVAPAMAGRFRTAGEDIKKLECLEPPPGRVVQEKMYEFWKILDAQLSVLPSHAKGNTVTQTRKWRTSVFDTATWTQHQVAAIHPFCDGNGRMSRLLTNLILSRYGLPPSQVKYEGEDKKMYLRALCQIDLYGDYEPLKKLIVRSVYEEYRKERILRRRNG